MEIKCWVVCIGGKPSVIGDKPRVWTEPYYARAEAAELNCRRADEQYEVRAATLTIAETK